MRGLTEGTENQGYWFVFPFVDQTDMSDAMQSVVCTGKIGGRKTGNIQTKERHKNYLCCAKK